MHDPLPMTPVALRARQRNLAALRDLRTRLEVAGYTPPRRLLHDVDDLAAMVAVIAVPCLLCHAPAARLPVAVDPEAVDPEAGDPERVGAVPGDSAGITPARSNADPRTTTEPGVVVRTDRGDGADSADGAGDLGYTGVCSRCAEATGLHTAATTPPPPPRRPRGPRGPRQTPVMRGVVDAP